MKKFAEKLKGVFAKALDEAAASEGKEESDKAKDDQGKVEPKADGSTSYDELVKMVKDLGSKIESMGKPKDAAESEKAPEKKDDQPAKDADVASSLEDRLKALEMAVAKLMEKQSTAGDSGEEEESETGDDDDGDEDPSMTGDTAARAEILSPGIKLTKDVKTSALKAAYATKEGKKVIDALSGGKTPTFDSAETVSTLFIAASEVLKASRGTGLEKTKDSKSFDSGVGKFEEITADRMNEINKAFYAQK